MYNYSVPQQLSNNQASKEAMLRYMYNPRFSGDAWAGSSSPMPASTQGASGPTYNFNSTVNSTTTSTTAAPSSYPTVTRSSSPNISAAPAAAEPPPKYGFTFTDPSGKEYPKNPDGSYVNSSMPGFPGYNGLAGSITGSTWTRRY